ncbi:NACHT domain-containing NTPase [Lentzea sp. HUAS12]|uniref:NACHT domain-containing protein n=1 Tax=Lentzea sp. HUAS12 TaxID=2951806 RepID=UPI00209E7EBC|nr:NACHT domain-containing protein [Lentzea sp. HUAS12]USX49326.1 NACHT domain-containing protein [Lentzea sp. HUAS12]
MTGIEKVAFDLGRVVIVQAAKLWLGAHQKKSNEKNDLIHLIGLQIPGLSAQRSLKRELDSIGDRVGERLTVLIQREFRDVDEAEVNAAILAVIDVVTESEISDRDLFDLDVDAHKLAKSLRRRYPSAPIRAGLSQSASLLYDRMLDDVCLSLVQIVTNLPVFSGRAHKEELERLRDISFKLGLILERTPITSLDAPAGAEHDKDFERTYLRRISTDLDRLELFGIRMRDHEMRPTLTVAYLNLSASDETKFSGPVQQVRRSRRRLKMNDLVSWTDSAADRGAVQTVRVPAILSQSGRTLIRGEAGHGKTTLLQWLAVCAARRQFVEELEAWNGCVPFFIRLRHWTEGELPGPEHFVSHFSASLGATEPKLWAHRVLSSGKALLLVDGVDEVASVNRKKVRSWLGDLLGTYPDIRVVVTSRPAAATHKWLSEQSFMSVHLHPMTPADVNIFVDRWHEAVKRNDSLPCAPELLPEYRRALMAHLAGRPKLRELATSPLLCAMLCALNLDRRKQLPQERLELYRAALDMLIERRDAERGLAQFSLDPTGKVSVLQNLAWRLSMNGRSELAKEEAEQYADKRLTSMPNASVGGREVVQHLVERSGVIREPVGGRIDFIHRTFQEYLTAKEVADEDYVGDLISKAHLDQWWHVVVMAAGHANTPQRVQLLNGLLGRSENEKQNRRRLRLLAVACQETAPTIPPEVLPALDAALEKVVPPKGVNEVGSLAQIGERLLNHLPQSLSGLSSAQAEATVRTVALVNGDAALRTLSSYSCDQRRGVQRELLTAWRYFDEVEYAKRVLADAPLLNGSITVDDRTVKCVSYLKHVTRLHVQLRKASLEELVGLNGIDSIELLGRESVDLSLLPTAGLRVLSIPLATEYLNIHALSSAAGLSSLFLGSRAELSESNFLASLEKLDSLSLGSVAEGLSLANLHGLENLKSLYLRNARNVALDLSSLSSLGDLELHSACASLIKTLGRDSRISSLLVSEPLEQIDLRQLDGMRLRDLQLFSCDVKNFDSLLGHEDLQVVSLVSCEGISSFAVLNELPNLRLLDIRGMEDVFDEKTLTAGQYQIVTDNVRLVEKLAAFPDVRERIFVVNEPRDSKGRVIRTRFYHAPSERYGARQGRIW